MNINTILRDVEAFNKAVEAQKKAWERSNSDYGLEYMEKQDKRGDKKKREAEAIAAKYGVKLEWNGLYPSFTLPDKAMPQAYTFESALSSVVSVSIASQVTSA